MKQELEQALSSLAKQLFGVETEAVLNRPDPQFGDYASNLALQLAKQLHKTPRDVATEITENFHHPLIASTNIAGPGFINLALTDEALWQLATSQPNQDLAGQTVLAEYSDPNPLKPLHAGHLYTTLVGDSIAMMLETVGAKVIRLNYGGDVGLHVAKNLWAVIDNLGGEYPEKLADINESERADWLGQRYVQGNNAYEDNELSRDEIIEVNKRVYQLHQDNDHDSAFAQIYWTVRQWSYDYFATLYQQLQVRPFDRFIPESEVTELGLQTVREQLDKGVYEESDGAIVFRGENYGLHTRVFINSAGLPTYEAKDVGLILTKWQDYKFDKSLVITANEQAQYYEVMLKSVEQFEPELVKRSMHLTHGVVKLQGGVKMSSRKGNVVTALEILEAAKAAAAASSVAHSDDSVLAAVKYAFAKNRIGGDIIYNPDESVALEGNSGPYLQYAHARARSILSKVERPQAEAAELDTDERLLLNKISQYSEVVETAAAELLPSHICTYLYELAAIFNRFYEHNRVIGDPRQSIRLKLVEVYADRLKQGLGLLNITAPDHM